MAITLCITYGTGHRPLEVQFTQPLVVLGRGKGSDVELPVPEVSLVHAEIRVEDDGAFITDRRSRNGTLVNGQELVPERRKLLRSNDRIAICGFEIEFIEGLAVHPSESRPDPKAEAYAFLRTILKKRGNLMEEHGGLVVLNGPESGRRISLAAPPAFLRIGRGEECEVRLDDGSASRVHAVLHMHWDGVHLEDLGSKNGTLLNGDPVRYQRLRDRDEIQAGATTLAFSDAASSWLEEVTSKSEKETMDYIPQVVESVKQEPPAVEPVEAEVPAPSPAREEPAVPIAQPRPLSDRAIMIIGGILLALSVIMLALFLR